MFKVKFLLSALSLVLLSACVTGQSDVDRLRQQIMAIERKHQQDNQEIIRQLEDYGAKIVALEEAMSEAGGSVQTTQANLWAEMESMRVQIATLTGTLDAMERQMLENRSQSQEAQRILGQLRVKTDDLDRSVQMMSSQLGVEVAERTPLPDAPDLETERVRVSDPADEGAARELYQRALDSFYDRDYDQAQALWEEFTDNFPGHALASNAFFWQGESFFQMQKYAQAVLAYQEVITNYPDSSKLSASMLKQGMSFMNLDREEPGRLVLNELINRFPDSAEARRARAFLSD
ncbi:tol-pal system protein YbgF [Desulfonatronovibrio magnus]|uniref:tol-pal system protein YbgF n=1 Tax=Desulfonatronovibrio magnus TaxID=698827 RepID=UPI0005EB12D9|nr:tol-pal system protein YbgF [Desulfonatronovibrio magnus]